MLGQLLESAPRRARRHYSALVSVVGHAMVVSGAVVAAHPVLDSPETDTVITWHPPAPPLPPCEDCTSTSRRGADGTGQGPTLPSPDRISGEITVEIPDDVAGPGDDLVIPSEEWRRGATQGRTEIPGSRLDRAIVDREVVPLTTNPVPRYPPALRAAHIEGKVVAQFVVDTTGRVVMSSIIVNFADHPAFVTAVIGALRQSRFQPAEARGRRVAQLVTQPFVFVIREER